jgi:RND family efflux transporter MFP subunit
LQEDNAITELEFEEAQGEFETAKASLVSAQANVASAVADTKSAQAQVAVARSEIAVAEASVISASAETQRLEALASYATIRAPFKGVVTARYVDTGQLIDEGTSGKSTPIVRLARDEKLRLQFDVPEKDVPYVKRGTPFTFLPDSLPHYPVSGKCTRCSSALEPESRTMLAEAEIENGDHILKPGMFVRTTVELEIQKDTLTLPATALAIEGGQVSVWVAENGAAELVPVEIGYDDGDMVEIVKGLTEESRVVIAGQVSLTNGTKVRVAAAR